MEFDSARPRTALRRSRLASALAIVPGKTPSGLALLGLGAAFSAILVSRRPDSLLHATFWGEDGWVWYPDAYVEGWRALGKPWTGYMQTLPRLTALLAQAMPLAWAPTVFAGAALAVQVMAALLLVSSRLAPAWPSFSSRLLFAVIYLLLPNSFEVYVNLTNAQWHLSLLAFLVLMSRPPEGWLQVAFDTAALVLCGLSGPFSLFLLPVALWNLHAGRSRWALIRLAILGGTAAIQIGTILLTGAGRYHPPLGASPLQFAIVVSLQIIAGAALGRHNMDWLLGLSWWQDNWLPVVLVLAGAVLLGLALVRGTPLLRRFCLFAGLMFAAALARPAGPPTELAWVTMSHPDLGDRYYMIPMLAWIAVLFALAADRWRAVRFVGLALLLVLLVDLPGDWHFGTDFRMGARNDFVARARIFDRAPQGTVMQFPVHPEGAPPMELTK